MALEDKKSIYGLNQDSKESVLANPKLESRESEYGQIQLEDVFANPKRLRKRGEDSIYGLGDSPIIFYFP